MAAAFPDSADTKRRVYAWGTGGLLSSRFCSCRARRSDLPASRMQSETAGACSTAPRRALAHNTRLCMQACSLGLNTETNSTSYKLEC